jgi:hypothetical protein
MKEEDTNGFSGKQKRTLYIFSVPDLNTPLNQYTATTIPTIFKTYQTLRIKGIDCMLKTPHLNLLSTLKGTRYLIDFVKLY